MTTFFYVVPFAENGNLTAIPVPTQGSGAESYNEGFTVNYEQDLIISPTTALPISRPQFNQLMFDVTNNIQQYQILGTPYWITAAQNNNGSGATPYPYTQYARVAYDAGSGMQIWESQVNSNVSTPGADENWLLANISAVGNPPGTIIDFAGTSPPTGYLLCDGSSYSAATYANLFSAIGYTWGGSSGTFLVPALQRRVTMGSGGSTNSIPYGVNGNAVGNIGGQEAHSMTTDEVVQHVHKPLSSTSTGFVISKSSGTSATSAGAGRTTDATTGVNLDGSSPSPGNAFNVMQPSAIVTKCIKY